MLNKTMLVFSLPILLLQAPPALGETTFEKIGFFLLLVGATNAITFFFTRRKNDADIAKTFSETIKNYIQSIREIQGTNDDMFDKIQLLSEEKITIEGLLASVLVTFDNTTDFLKKISGMESKRHIVKEITDLRERILETKRKLE